MKRLLIIANLEHASPRIPGLTENFREYGWDVTVVTPQMGEQASQRLGFPEQFSAHTKIVLAPFRGDVFWRLRAVLRTLGLRKEESFTEQIKGKLNISSQRSVVDSLMRWYQTFFAFPDTERTWYRSAFRTADELLQKEKFDLILSSAPFPTVHRVASALKRKHGVPWVADFRDPWTQNPVYNYPYFRKILEQWLERRTIAPADAIDTVTPFDAAALERFHGKKVHVIPNGYTYVPEPKTPIPLTNPFTVTYAGTTYVGNQDPEKFLSAVHDLIAEGAIPREKIRVRYFGKKENWLDTLIQKFELSDVAQQYGKVSRTESFLRQRESQVLLYYNWEDLNHQSMSHLKFFEYLSAGRPILATGGPDSGAAKDILRETRSGRYAPTTQDVKRELLKLYREFEAKGAVSYDGDREAISQYGYRSRGRELAKILDSVVRN